MISVGIATKGLFPGQPIGISTRGYFESIGETIERMVIITLISEIKLTIDLDSKVE